VRSKRRCFSAGNDARLDHSHQPQQHAYGARPTQHRQHAMLKRKIAVAAADRQNQPPENRRSIAPACRTTAERSNRRSFPEHGVECEPDRQIEDHADDRGGDRRQRACQPLVAARVSTNGAPRKIQRKQGVNVTQVGQQPPSVRASIGGSVPGSR